MSKLRKSARDRQCTIRIPGVCNRNPETTVLAHLNGAGMGMKHGDMHGAYACSSCHDLVDARTTTTQYSKDELALMHLEGMVRTQKIMLDEGLILIP